MALVKKLNNDYRNLERIFSLGAILACTPPKLDTDFTSTLCRKCYAALIMIVLMAINIYEVQKTIELLEEDQLTRQVVNIQEQALVGCFLYLIIIKTNFSHVGMWKNFQKNISFLENHFGSPSSNKKCGSGYLIEFISSHALFISINIYHLYFLRKSGVHKFFQLILYYYYFELYCMHNIIKLIGRYFEDLNQKLSFVNQHILYENCKIEKLRV